MSQQNQIQEPTAQNETPDAQPVKKPAIRWLTYFLLLPLIALATAALGEIEAEARLLERQWSLKRERARYDAERARRQYDAVEPENRLVARSLERVWEEVTATRFSLGADGSWLGTDSTPMRLQHQ